jgi:hemerythrin-like domain-containing protein
MATEARGTDAIWAFEEHEHRDLARGINHIHEVACEIGSRTSTELSSHILGVLDWLECVLDPHIAWEEGWLYPEIDARTGTPWATRAAQFDHQQLRNATERLRAERTLLSSRPAGDQQAETRCLLFSLEVLLRAHIEREERFLVPLLNEPAQDVARPAVALESA